MADREAQQKLYAYSEMSNKVQKADRSQRRSRGAGDGTGEVESFRGRNNVGRMGDRVAALVSMKQERPAELEDRMKKAKKKSQKREGVGMGDHSKNHNILMSSGGQSILDMGELNVYQPTHAGSRASYESLLVRMIKCNTLSDAIKIQSWKSTHTFPARAYFTLYNRA